VQSFNKVKYFPYSDDYPDGAAVKSCNRLLFNAPAPLKHLFEVEIEGGKVSLRCSGLAFWLGFGFKRRVGLQTVHGALTLFHS